MTSFAMKNKTQFCFPIKIEFFNFCLFFSYDSDNMLNQPKEFFELFNFAVRFFKYKVIEQFACSF